MYGNHRDFIAEKMYHKCGICDTTVLLDSDDIAHHLRKYHSITHKNYNEKFMVRKNEKKNPEQNLTDHISKDNSALSLKVNEEYKVKFLRTSELISHEEKEIVNNDNTENHSTLFNLNKVPEIEEEIEMTTDELLSALYNPYFLERIM